MNTRTYAAPITLSASVQSQVYTAFALAMFLTAVGAYAGMLFAPVLFGSGVFFFLMIAELLLVFTAQLWIAKAPLNYALFALFPLLSGITLAPLLIVAIGAYANGGMIVLDAAIATAAIAGCAAVLARTTRMNLSSFSGIFLLALLGIIVLSLVQLFVPALRTGTMEIVISGALIAIMAGFTAIDIQRINRNAALGGQPLLLALSLYLDMFNLFVAVLRFMLAIAGDRR